MRKRSKSASAMTSAERQVTLPAAVAHPAAATTRPTQAGSGWLQRLPPAIPALGLHLPIWAVLLATCRGVGSACGLGPGALTWVEGLMAWAVTRGLGLPRWWQPINLFFFPLLGLALWSEIDPVWALVAFVALVLTSLGSLRTRVPLFLSSRQAVAALARCIPTRPGQRLIDLGCGLGGPLAGLARLRPDLVLHGVEAAPLSWLVSRLRLDGRARIHLGSLWDEDLSRFDVVYAYLSPAPMARLWDKACREMRPGSLLISNSFEVPGVAPDRVIALDDLSRSRLLLWRIP